MDTVAVAGRMLISLAVVLAFMWLIARRLKKPGRAASGDLVDVLARRQLSRTASVAVVRVLDQALIIGITDGQVSLIGQTDLAAASTAAEDVPNRAPRPLRSPRPPRAARPQPVRRQPAHPRPARPQPGRPGVRRTIAPDGRIVELAPAGAAAAVPPARPSALAGSALSVDTWRRTVASLRGLTGRRR